MFMLGCSMLGFGLSNLIDGNNTLFLVVVFFTRALQGVATACNDTVILSITGLLYKDHQELVIAIILTVGGVAYTIAPVFGSILYTWFGVMSPFFFLSAIMFFFFIFITRIIDDNVNTNLEDSYRSAKPNDAPTKTTGELDGIPTASQQ